jgi:hypothetical protein
VAVAVAAAGFAVARRLARESRQMEGIAVTALLGVLLSPVSWIHHFLVVVVVIGAILADGRSPRRVAIAAGTAAFFALTIPWWGRSLLGQPEVPVLAARVVEDAFGIAAVALIVIIARLPAADRRVARSLTLVIDITRRVIPVALIRHVHAVRAAGLGPGLPTVKQPADPSVTVRTRSSTSAG